MAGAPESPVFQIIAIVALALGSGCAHSGRSASGPAQGRADLDMARETPKEEHAAHDLLIEAASCWFGGLWGDVQGEAPAERKADAEKRCASVVRHVYGSDDRVRYEQLRAFEAIAIDELTEKIATLAAEGSPHKDALVRLTRALAGAQRETMLARRAGHRILRDVEHEPERLSSDEAAALPELEAAAGFDALYSIQAADLQKEAHAFALLVALDRMNIAQEIPLHLKPYVVVGPFHSVFGAAIPDLPHDASKPLPRAGWLTYLTGIAAAAGHPVAPSGEPPQIRREHAMRGILAGISDKLKVDAEGLEPSFLRIIHYVIRDLDAVSEKRGAASSTPRGAGDKRSQAGYGSGIYKMASSLGPRSAWRSPPPFSTDERPTNAPGLKARSLSKGARTISR